MVWNLGRKDRPDIFCFLSEANSHTLQITEIGYWRKCYQSYGRKNKAYFSFFFLNGAFEVANFFLKTLEVTLKSNEKYEIWCKNLEKILKVGTLQQSQYFLSLELFVLLMDPPLWCYIATGEQLKIDKGRGRDKKSTQVII